MKHIGRLKQNKRKLVVAYRVIPGDPDYCLVVHSDSLSAEYHDSMMKLLESEAGQSAYEFAEIMARVRVPDGRIMLHAFHNEGKLDKVPTNVVEMIPNTKTTIMLNDLNMLIAQQRGVSVAELALGAERMSKAPESPIDSVEAASAYVAADATGVVSESVIVDEKPLSDEDLGKSYIAQAEELLKESRRLRQMGKKLLPKKTEPVATEEVKTEEMNE